MNGSLRIDRDILIIVIVATISGLGICLLLLIGRLQTSGPIPVADVTNTPFKYLFLATEISTIDPNTLIATPEIPSEEFILPTSLPTEGIEPSPVVLSSVAPGATSTAATNSIATTVVPTVDEAEVFFVGTFNDTDPRIEYDGDWTNELFVDDASEETLYISTSTGNTAKFTFLGKQVVIGYLGSNDVDLGTATILIDGTSYQMDQTSGDNWASPQLTSAQHTVVITHKTGDLIFLDYVEIR